MHSRPLLLSAFLFSILLFSCTKKSGSIDDVQWLSGKWGGVDVNTLKWTETWRNSSGKTLTGYIVALTPDGDTILHENPKIDLVDGVPYFITTVPKNPSPVLFRMLGSSDGTSAVFENREQDFPQRITYTKISDTMMEVKLEGLANGAPKTEMLKFVRLKEDIPALNLVK